MMMAYGLFVFSLPTLAYQQLERDTQGRPPRHSGVGGRPQRQYVGPGDDTITLTGLLLPQFKGSPLSLDALRAMADDGKAWPLVAGYGRVYGAFIIESIREGQTLPQSTGAAQRIEFTILLKRIDASLIDSLGLLGSSAASLFGI
jgi:phage protein U